MRVVSRVRVPRIFGRVLPVAGGVDSGYLDRWKLREIVRRSDPELNYSAVLILTALFTGHFGVAPVINRMTPAITPSVLIVTPSW